MASIYIGNNQISKIYVGNNQIKKIYIGSNIVYNCGNVVTYYIDTNVVYSEEVESGGSCLSPQTFTPYKVGYSFVGWRTDSVASGEVLSSKTMEDSPISLYAVFSKSVTLCTYNASVSVSYSTKNSYYNNGNYNHPTFTLLENSYDNWSAEGWTTHIDGYVSTLDNGGTVTLSENTTYYSLYSTYVTLTTYNASTQPTTRSRKKYANFHNYLTTNNPSFTLSENAYGGWTAEGWTTDPNSYSATVGNGGVVTLSSNATYYSLYSIYVTLTTYNASTDKSTIGKKKYLNCHSELGVSNPTFVLSQNGVSGWTAIGWTNNTNSYSASIANGGSVTLSENATYYSLYSQTITVTYYNGSSSPSYAYGTRYANYHSSWTSQDPSFTLTQASVSNWSPRGWSLSTSGDGSIYMNNGTAYTLGSNTTVYGCYYRTVTVYYNSNGGSGSMSNSTGTGYYNSIGNFTEATIYLKSNTFTAPNTDKYANGWNISSPYVSVSDKTVYAQWADYTATPFTLFDLDYNDPRSYKHTDGTYGTTYVWARDVWDTTMYYAYGSEDGSNITHEVQWTKPLNGETSVYFYSEKFYMGGSTNNYVGYRFTRTIDRQHCKNLDFTYYGISIDGGMNRTVNILINDTVVATYQKYGSIPDGTPHPTIDLSGFGQTIKLTIDFAGDEPTTFTGRRIDLQNIRFS